MLHDFTLEPLRAEVMAAMPTRRGGNPRKVSSYLELVNWIICMHADESTEAGLVEQFHQARQKEDEHEMSYAERLRGLKTACGLLHSTGALKGRYVEGVHHVVRATLRERNKPELTLAELSRIARTPGDEYRWIQAAQQKERAEKAAKRAEATRRRRQAKALSTPRYPVRPRTTRTEPGQHSVATTTPPQGGGSGKSDKLPVLAVWPDGPLGRRVPQVGPSSPCPISRESSVGQGQVPFCPVPKGCEADQASRCRSSRRKRDLKWE